MTKSAYARHWEEFREIVRSRWGDITDQEFDYYEQDLALLSELIAAKYHTDQAEVRSQLRSMVLALREGHPMLYDHFAGIDQVGEQYQEGILIDSSDPGSQEWQARQDVHREQDRRDQSS
jgi:hypothetical protein